VRRNRARYLRPVRPLLPVALLIGLAAVACQERPTVVTAREMLSTPAGHDGQRVVISGVVENPRKRLPPEGNGYTSFTLADGTAHVPVIAWGTEHVGAGDIVEVRGVFHSRMLAGSDVLHDVVEAAFVRPFRKATQPPGTPVGPP
jgi:hypothetical protein